MMINISYEGLRSPGKLKKIPFPLVSKRRRQCNVFEN